MKVFPTINVSRLLQARHKSLSPTPTPICSTAIYMSVSQCCSLRCCQVLERIYTNKVRISVSNLDLNFLGSLPEGMKDTWQWSEEKLIRDFLFLSPEHFRVPWDFHQFPSKIHVSLTQSFSVGLNKKVVQRGFGALRSGFDCFLSWLKHEFWESPPPKKGIG